MRKRRTYEVVYDDNRGDWTVRRRSSKRVVARRGTKDAAVKAGAEIARRYSHVWPSQLVVYKQDGQFDFERTYPDTTPKAKG